MVFENLCCGLINTRRAVNALVFVDGGEAAIPRLRAVTTERVLFFKGTRLALLIAYALNIVQLAFSLVVSCGFISVVPRGSFSLLTALLLVNYCCCLVFVVKATAAF